MSTLARPAFAETTVAARPSKKYFRTDVEGLRAIAVTAVVAFHAGVPLLTGGFVGVDVFFVISGFLITGLLLREAQTTGRIGFQNFYARRARRIMPAATLVLVATMVGAIFVMPLLQLYKTAQAVLSAGLYYANWYFIGVDTDYFAQNAAESPVLHYWSLAVEEQFYLAWPLLVLGAVVLARRWPLAGTRVIVAVFAVVTVASLALSIVTTQLDPTTAYMSTFTRAWQFGLGALIAAVGHWMQGAGERRMPRTAGIALGWLGLAGLAVSMFLLDGSTPYPGTAALLPTLAVGAVIAGGTLASSGRGTVGALLSLRPVRYIGRLSFGWYLWHWPLLILVEAKTGELSWQWKSILMLIALGLAAATLHLFEMPLQHWRHVARRAMPAIALGMLCIVLASTSSLVVGSSAVRALSTTNTSVVAGSADFTKVFGASDGQTGGAVTPSAFDAPKDSPGPSNCLLDHEVGVVLSCTVGVKNGTPVVLFGDSHAQQWQPALEELATKYKLTVSVFTKAGCPAADIQARAGDDSRLSQPECTTWRHAAEQMIVDQIHPALIFTSSVHTYVPDANEALAAWQKTLDVLRGAKVPIVYLRDTPHPNQDIPTCISGSLDDWAQCDFPRDSFPEPIIEQTIAGKEKQVYLADLDGYLCDDNTCSAVQNGLLLYRDDSHLTATAAKALAPALESVLVKDDLLHTE